MDFTLVGLPGAPFTYEETYVYYDGPKTFALKSTALPFYYIVNVVDEDDDGTSITALAVAIDNARFRAIRSGLVRFRDAYELSREGSVYQVTWSDVGQGDRLRSQVEQISTAELPNAWLPAARARLDLPTATVEAFRETQILELSDAQQRTIFALEVEAANTNVTAFPARNSGNLQVSLHGTFDALGKEFAAGSDALRDIYPTVLDLGAASFVVVMAVETRTGMLEPVEVSGQILDSLSTLVAAVGSGDSSTFIAAMRAHRWRARNRFRELLESLIPVESGLSLSIVKAFSAELQRASATARQVKAAVQALDDEQPEIKHVEISRGVLVGLVLPRRRFEIVDLATGTTYSGHMTESAASEANNFIVGDASYVSASIRAEIAFAAQDEAKGTKYWLEQISRHLTPPSSSDESSAKS